MSKKIVLILLLAVTPAIYYLIKPGFYEPQDLHHLADIYQMARAFASGQIPPRLGPDFTFGYSYPLFNFYYVLPFYIGALFYALFGSLTASFESVFVLSAVLSVFGMYLFLREFFDKLPSFVGSLLFLYTPYRAVQIYVRGAMGEALALSILPFVFWAGAKLIKKPNAVNVSILALTLSVFLLSHNYLWLLSAVWIVLFIVCILVFEKEKIKIIKNLALSVVLGLGMSFYWWFPAFFEYHLVSSVTPFLMEDHFPFIKQLIIPSWGHGASVWGPTDEMSFQIGIVNLVVIASVLGILLFVRKLFKNKRVLFITLWAILGFFVSVFFMNIRSLFLWKILPFYQFIQFPWRLLFLTTFFTSVLAAVIVHILPKKFTKITGLLFIGASLVLTTQYFRPSKIVFKGDDVYLQRFFESRNYSEDYLLLPKWVDERPSDPPLLKFEAGDAVISDIKKITPVFYQAEIDAGKPTTISFNTYYFPGWFAKIDGKISEIKPGKPYGQIELNVPEGNHKVEFYWKETNLRKISDYISLLSLLFIGFLVRSRRVKKV